MTDIAVPLPDGRWLVLSRDVFQQALADGASVAATNTTQSAVVDHEERWLTSQQLAEHTGIGDTTLEGWAKQGVIPCIRAGKALRFKISEVEAALRHADLRTATHLQLADNSGAKTVRNRRTTAHVIPANGVNYGR